MSYQNLSIDRRHKMPVIPKTIYALAVTFVYGLIAYFWPAVPFDQAVFSLVVIAVLSAVGIEVSAEVKKLRSELRERGLLG
jgi:hypothetical protein